MHPVMESVEKNKQPLVTGWSERGQGQGPCSEEEACNQRLESHCWNIDRL